MVHCSTAGIWQYRKPHWSRLLFLQQSMVIAGFCLSEAVLASLCGAETLSLLRLPHRNPQGWEQHKSLAASSAASRPGRSSLSRAFLGRPFLGVGCNIVSFPNFSCTCTWVNRAVNLRNYFLMETDPFLQICQVDASPKLPKPSKSKEYSQGRQLILYPYSYTVAPDLKCSLVAHSAPLVRC